MKLSEKWIRKVILEELGDSFVDASSDIEELMRFAKAYARLGGAIQEQLDRLLAGDFESLNFNAVREIGRTLGRLSPDIADAVEDWEIEMNGPPSEPETDPDSEKF